jgi:hypothetical protein
MTDPQVLDWRLSEKRISDCQTDQDKCHVDN